MCYGKESNPQRYGIKISTKKISTIGSHLSKEKQRDQLKYIDFEAE